ncbi:DUF6603 domain-containing protein [Rhizobacter sp. OV335]|uniref:DUF6603 domain-containing protein n=1 Tax=Rhizobacter sp. OV335 TaxID=1500264 RepID=UPI000910418D|nr:DUF6603 domain-containing protein [Rhizobacter sp. OV335]SHN13495.1 hypothetical protein SAMN02787076_03523 [Rhizobacter sp. OV335]
MNDTELLRGLIDDVVLALAPLVEAAHEPDACIALLRELGWATASVPAPLQALAAAGAGLLDALAAEPGERSGAGLLASIAPLVNALQAIGTQPDSAFPDSVDIAAFKATIARDLLNHVIVEHLLGRRYRIGRWLKLAGIVQLVAQPASGRRLAFTQRRIDWPRVGALLTDPVAGFRDSHAWISAAPQRAQAFGDIAAVIEGAGLDLSYFKLDPGQLAFASAGSTQGPAQALGVRLDFNETLGLQAGSEAGLQLLLRPATAQRGEALAVLPFATLGAGTASTDDSQISLAISGDADLAQGFALTWAPGRALEVDAGFLRNPPAAASPTRLQLDLRVPPPAGDAERVLLGAADRSRLAMRSVTLSAGVASAGALDAFVELGLEKLHLAVKPSADDTDSFMASLLGPDGISAEFSVGLRLSSLSGFHLSGSGGLQGRFPVGLRLGPLDIDAVTLGLTPNAQGLDLDVGASVRGRLGPVRVLADATGLRLAARFPDPPVGNLGPLDVGLGFKPPSGIGLTVDAQGVLTGGGFLFHDEAQGLYAGAMQLSLHERITLKAFGLIATRLPDGSRGYSLLVFITAEDFQPIPLGLGFTLLGIGGMVGVNRSFDQDVMRQGLRNGTLATLLFPRDPVGNAPALIRSLAAAFPARRGSYLLGLLARIGWFTPTLVLMDLALILEFGSRTRLLALGRISALLPSAANDLVRLNMEAMGVIDFDAGTAAVDAVLVDSRLAHKFAITGSAALRAGFASGPSFVLAVGGLNPHFAPPAGFPALDRVAIALSSGNNPRLVCDAYFAITSNTVQFGAHASLYASAAGFSVEGDVGFDVLVQLAPLHFIADYHARLQLKRGSYNLFMVELAGELEGPRPLRLSGKASFKIFWFHFSVHFDATLVSGEPPPLPDAVDVLAQLKQALVAPSAWRIERSADHPHGVALRSLPPSSALVLDPLGRLSVTQQVVPLNTARDIDTFGGAPVLGARRFAVTASMNGAPLASTARAAAFAPAQYFTMTDDQRLAAPAFETMDAGCVFGSTALLIDAPQSVAATLGYRTVVVGEAAVSAPYVLPAAQLPAFSRSGSAARAPVRQVGRARFRSSVAAPAATLQAPQWRIAANTGGTALPALAGAATWSEQHAALSTLNRGKALYQLLPAHELLA